MPDAGNPFKDLQEHLNKFAVYNPKFFSEGTTTNDIVSVDDSLTSTEPVVTDSAIIYDVLDEEGSATKDDTDDVLMNQMAHNLMMCIKFSMYFENTCYLVIMESLFTNI